METIRYLPLTEEPAVIYWTEGLPGYTSSIWSNKTFFDGKRRSKLEGSSRKLS